MDTTEPADHVVIVAGGGLGTTISAPPGAFVIAADSGYDHAVEAGIAVHLLIGDLDSISPTGRAHAEAHGVAVSEHDLDKDATDLELAIDAALARRARRIDIFGGEGGTIGHLLTGVLSITGERLEPVDVQWHVASGTLLVVRPGRAAELIGTPGDTVSVVPVGSVTGVRTEGLRWRLDGEDLPAGSTRGVSNQLIGDRATVHIEHGVALIALEGA